ncbi:MAG: hypothetical protein KFF73_12925 [Cyclobacteriaceae bacterium]|nr:hypothetical protein [Cyclobacteriaceae bacterium]
MKTTRFILIASIFLFKMGPSYAQQTSGTQLLLIHEDRVMAGKNSEYQKAGEGLAKLLSESNFKDLSFTAFQLDDYTYMYVSPIQNMAQLDVSPWEKLSQQSGEDKVESAMAAFDGTYDTHRDFIAVFHPDLSYKTEKMQEEGNNYRRWMYFYYNQINQENVMNMVKEWKKLYEENDIPQGYAVYTNGFGHEGPVLVIHSWAKSAADHAQWIEKRNEMLGDKARELWGRTESLAYRIENKTGWLIPNLSYMPQE